MTQPRSRVDLYAAIRRDADLGCPTARCSASTASASNRDSGAGICMAEGESNRPNAAHGLTRTEW